MQFRTAGPDIVWSAGQRALLACWVRLRGPGAMPAWSDLPADDLSRHLECLMFLDAVLDDAGLRFRIRFLGSRIAASYGADFTGQLLDEAIPPAWRDNALRTYRETIARKRPIYNVVDTQDRDGSLVRIERLLLPFSGDGGIRVLASIETFSMAGREQEELGRSPYASGSCALVAVIET